MSHYEWERPDRHTIQLRETKEHGKKQSIAALIDFQVLLVPF
jgi:hypothetical protein